MMAWMRQGGRVNLPSWHGCSYVLGLTGCVLGLTCQVVMNAVACGHACTVSKFGYGMAALYWLVCLVRKGKWDISNRTCVLAVESHIA